MFDPHEAHNVAAVPLNAPALEEMRARLLNWMERTHDPVLAGEPVPAPAGAQVNDPAGFSPSEPTVTVG